MEEGGRGVLAVANDVVGKAPTEVPDGALEYPLAGGLLTVAGAVGFDVQRQRQPGADDTEERQVMAVADNGARGVADRMAQRAVGLLAPPRAGAVQGQPDEAAAFKRFVALRAAHDLHECLPRRRGVEPFGEVGEGIVAESAAHAQRPASRRADQRLNGMEGPRPEHLPHELGP